MIADVLAADRQACAEAIAADVEAEFVRAMAGAGRFSIAVPGGSVAAAAFPVLAALDLDWRRADIFWVDERAVSPSDAESNYAVAKALWLKPAGVPDRSVHRMPAERDDLSSAADEYARELVRTVGPSAVLDYVLLGVGPDGHVASLFPGHAALSDTSRRVLAIEDSPKPPSRRLTLTLPVLVSARRVLVAAFGPAKAPVLQEILTNETSMLPVARVLRQTARPKLVHGP